MVIKHAVYTVMQPFISDYDNEDEIVFRFNRPVRAMLDRDEDMTATGTRHPVIAKYKVRMFLYHAQHIAVTSVS